MAKWRQLTGLRLRPSFWPSRRQNLTEFDAKIWRFFETAAAKIAFVVRGGVALFSLVFLMHTQSFRAKYFTKTPFHAIRHLVNGFYE